MAVKFLAWGNAQFVIPSTGAPASGYKLYSYVAGSSTPVTLYTTSVGNVAQSNPVILNAAGFPTTGQLWATEGTLTKLIFTDDNDVPIKTEDQIPGANDSSSTTDQWIPSNLTPTYVSATSFTLVGDQTSAFQVGRRLKTTNSGGTVYSTITASAFSVVTTVTVANDSGTLDAGLSAVSYGLLSRTNDSMPRGIFPVISNISGYLYGRTLSNNAGDATNDIDITAGVSVDAAGYVMVGAALTKRSDAAWAVGTGNGWLDTGAIGNGTYFVFDIMRLDTGVVDSLLSLEPLAPTMPANYTAKRRVGAIIRSGGAIRLFVQDGNEFWYKVPIADVSANNPGTAAVTRTLSVPAGIRVKALLSVSVTDVSGDGNATFAYISDLSSTDTAASIAVGSVAAIAPAATSAQLLGDRAVWTNTNAQVRSRLSRSTADQTLGINTQGWIDLRRTTA